MTSINVFGQNIDSVYQKILVDFYKRHLNESLFDNECTKLKFNKKYKVALNVDSTLWTVEPFIISNYFGSNLLTLITSEMDTSIWNWLSNEKTIINLNIDINNLPLYTRTSITEAPNGKSFKFYLLRLSSPIILDKYCYIELWVKENYYSSGTRIIYKIDSKGNIVDFKKYNLCDDLG